jgi:hypothetical protein
MKEDKKKKSEMSDLEKHAKMSVLKDARDMAASAMGQKLHGLKKVSVMAPDREGLAKGLHKAQELLGSSEDDLHEPEEMPKDVDEPEDTDMSEISEHPLDDHHTSGPKDEMEESSDSEAEESPIEPNEMHEHYEHLEHLDPHELEKHIAHLTMMKHKKMGM